MTKTDFRSNCPVATALDIVGDKWTLLIVRDLFFGSKRFNDFMDSPESMRSNILTDRLQKLEAEGLIERKPYQENPIRYEYALTEKGMDLRYLMRAMVEWSNDHYPHTYRPFEDGGVEKPTPEKIRRP